VYYKHVLRRGLMTTSVRMDSETERLLDTLARERGSTKSEIVREGVRLVAQKERRQRRVSRPYEAFRTVIGSVRVDHRISLSGQANDSDSSCSIRRGRSPTANARIDAGVPRPPDGSRRRRACSGRRERKNLAGLHDRPARLRALSPPRGTRFQHHSVAGLAVFSPPQERPLQRS